MYIVPIGDKYKDLLLDWDHAISEIDVSPDKIGASSKTLVHWKCHICGTEWDDTVNNRARMGKKCPVCSNNKKYIKVGYNDLATLRPDLLKDWDYEKNSKKPTELRISSHYQAHWKCHKCGHEWCSRLEKKKKNGSGCPVCNVGGGCSVADYFLFLCVKEYYNGTYYRKNVGGYELDTFISSLNIGIEFDGYAYHNEVKDKLKDLHMQKKGYIVFHIKERKDEQLVYTIDKVEDTLYVPHVCATTLALYKEAVLSFLKYLKLINKNVILSDNLKKISYDDILNVIHSVPYNKSVKSKDDMGLYTLKWDYKRNSISPDKLYATDSSKRYFKCDFNHSVLMRVSSVYKEGYGCPICSGSFKVVGINSPYETAYNASLLLNNLKGYKSLTEWSSVNKYTIYTCPMCGKQTVVSTLSIQSPVYAFKSICNCSPVVSNLEISIFGKWEEKGYVYFAVQADNGFIFFLMEYLPNIKNYFGINPEDIPNIDKELGRLLPYKCCIFGMSRYNLIPYSLFKNYKHRNVYIENNLHYAVDLLINQKKSYNN